MKRKRQQAKVKRAGVGGGGVVGCRCSSTYTNLQVSVNYVMLVNVMNTF